jgi:hypothetical protein
MIAASAFLIGAPTGAAAQQRVNWTDLVNAEVRGTGVEKTRGCDGCGDAGATSTQVIESNGGYVEFRVPDDWTYLVAGLANRTRGTRLEDIEFGIRFNGNGSADIVERRSLAATRITGPATPSVSRWPMGGCGICGTAP